jgi:hypothetical protein
MKIELNQTAFKTSLDRINFIFFNIEVAKFYMRKSSVAVPEPMQ